MVAIGVSTRIASSSRKKPGLSTHTVGWVPPSERTYPASPKRGMSSARASVARRFSVSVTSRSFSGGQETAGKPPLERDDGRRGLRRVRLARTQRAQLRRDVGGQRAADGRRSLVLACEVARLRERQAALAQVDQVDAGVLEVGHDPDPVERADAVLLEGAHDRRQARMVREAVGEVQEMPDGIEAGRLDRRLIHACREVVAEAALRGVHRRRVGTGGGCRGLLRQLMEQRLIAHVELHEAAPDRVLRRHGVGVQPAAVGVAEEVVRGRRGRVEGGGVERSVGHR